jgi:fucose permease
MILKGTVLRENYFVNEEIEIEISSFPFAKNDDIKSYSESNLQRSNSKVWVEVYHLFLIFYILLQITCLFYFILYLKETSGIT